jgi:hypothetical protein
MNGKTLATFAILALMSGCPECDPTPSDPCDPTPCSINSTCSVENNQPICTCKDGWEGDTCTQQNLCWGKDPGHGTCDHATGVITCNSESTVAKWYPDTTGKCMWLFNPEDPTYSLVHAKACPSDSAGTLTVVVTDSTSPYFRHNGDWMKWDSGTTGNCAWAFMNPGTLQVPPGLNRPGGTLLDTADGIEFSFVDVATPILPNGSTHTVSLLKKVQLCRKMPKGPVTPLYFDAAGNAFADVDFSIVPEEECVEISTDRQGGLYFANFAPSVSGNATQEGVNSKNVIVDLTGTTDEGSDAFWGLTVSISADGTPQNYEKVSLGVYRITVSGGNHTVGIAVDDPYGKSGSKQVSLTVDLCTGIVCQLWQNCRPIDGVCVGSDPCTPNPCVHGTCGNSTGQAVCVCSGNWSGGLCDTCPPGFTGADCHVDLCYQVGCNSHGSCNATSGHCDCDPGYDTAQSCAACLDGYKGYPNCVADLCHNVNCPDDGDKCNGTEACDPGTGTCIHLNPVSCPDDHNVCNGTEHCDPSDGLCKHVNPLSCDNGLACDGTEHCDPTAGCKSGTAVNCGAHGTCQEPSGSCGCSGNWTGPTCATCPSGFYVDGTGNCVTDHCYGVTCDDGNPCNGTETCDKATGCKAGTPVVCPDDGDKCNGTEQCNPLNGQCIHVNPLTCDDGLRCDGTETCNPTTGCVSGTAETCSGHGSCQEAPSALCNCAGNWTGPNCATCPAGFTGSDCHVDLCYLNTCSGHGSCNATNGSCSCSGGWHGSDCSIPPPPTVGNVVMVCPGGWCNPTVAATVTFDSANADTYEVTLESQIGIWDPGSCMSQASPTTCTPIKSGDVVKVKAKVCNAGGTQCAEVLSVDTYNVA